MIYQPIISIKKIFFQIHRQIMNNPFSNQFIYYPYPNYQFMMAPWQQNQTLFYYPYNTEHFFCNLKQNEEAISKIEDIKQQNEKKSDQNEELQRCSKQKCKSIKLLDQSTDSAINEFEKRQCFGNRYLYKNTQSNICNQIFSFLMNRTKSEDTIKKILQNTIGFSVQKLNTFYRYIKIIKRKTKKYINKKLLLSVCRFNSSHPSFKDISKNQKKLKILNGQQLAKITRIGIFIYLSVDCPSSLMTSKKIDKQTRMSHFSRRRIIKQFLESQFQNK